MRRQLTSPATVLALLALVVALGGTSAVAAPAVRRLIDGKTVKKNSLPGDRVRRDSLGSVQIDERRLGVVPRARRADAAAKADQAGTATRADSAARADAAGRAETAGRADSAAIADAVKTSRALPLVRAAATAGATEAQALAAAPELPLDSRGPFTLYAKCVVVDDRPSAQVFVRTTAAGTLVATSERGFLAEPATAEADRRVAAVAPLVDLVAEIAATEVAYTIAERDGTAVRGTIVAHVRAPGGAAGPLRGDERCLVTGTIGD